MNFLLTDRPGHFGALVKRPELYQNSRYTLYLYHPVTSYGPYLRPVCPSKVYFVITSFLCAISTRNL